MGANLSPEFKSQTGSQLASEINFEMRLVSPTATLGPLRLAHHCDR